MTDYKSKAITPMTLTVIPHTSYTSQRIIQNFVLIWADADIDESKSHYQSILEQFHSVVSEVNTFTDPDQCVDFLSDIDQGIKAFLIAGYNFINEIMHLIHDISQLDTIIITCNNKASCEQWAKNWTKLNGVYTEISAICEALQLFTNQCNRNSVAISFLFVGEGASGVDLNQLEPSFMYTQIFKEIILEMHHDQQAVKGLAKYCRGLYQNNVHHLNVINEFENDYRPETSIYWYTREPFAYEMLNRALRNLEGDIIINMRFFIHDLHREIEALHTKQVNNYKEKAFLVYRGQGLSKTDFKKLQQTKGGLLSFNNFLSTSNKREVSLIFADSVSQKNDMVGIFFIMTIDPKISSAPFANIRDYSKFEEEEEILFSMHTVFRITDIEQIDKNNPLYQVKLQLTSDDDEQLRVLTQRMREEVGGSGWERIGKLLLQMGQFNKAEELYEVLLQKTYSESEKAYYYNQLGFIRHHQGDYEKAIWYIEQALQIEEKTLPRNHLDFATSHNNIGMVYMDMGDYSKGLSFHEKSLEMRQKTLPPNHPHLATSYNNIGLVYDNMGEYSKSLPFHEKSLEIYQKTLPPNHPLLATSYNNIGLVYYKMAEYSKALPFHENSLAIRQQTLPSNHPDLATSYNNIGLVYEKRGEYSKSLPFHEKSLEIYQKTLPPNHPLLATSYNNIGVVYDNMGEYSKSLPFYEKSLEIRLRTLPPNHPSLAISYNNIGLVYRNMGKYSKALSFYEKSLEIRQQTFPPNHPDLAQSYNNSGMVYYNMKEYSKALSFHEKSLEIYRKTLPPNHPDLGASYNNIGLVYDNMGEHSKSLSFYEKSLEIKRKALSPNHPLLATSYNNIGMVYNNMREYSKALSFHEKSLEIRQQTLAPNHPDMAQSFNNIGLVYDNMKQYSTALSFYERALNIWKSSLPSNHPHIKIAGNNIKTLKENM